MLKIQNLLHICSEHYEDKETKEPKESDSRDTKDPKGKPKEATSSAPKEAPKPKLDGSHQGVAVLGISLIAMGEEIGAQMALRTFRHLVSWGGSWGGRCVRIDDGGGGGGGVMTSEMMKVRRVDDDGCGDDGDGDDDNDGDNDDGDDDGGDDGDVVMMMVIVTAF